MECVNGVHTIVSVVLLCLLFIVVADKLHVYRLYDVPTRIALNVVTNLRQGALVSYVTWVGVGVTI